MSTFNYRTKKDPLESLNARVERLESILRKLEIWIVNDISQGANRLRRRKIRPVVDSGAVYKGPWFDVDVFSDEFLLGKFVSKIVAGSNITISPTTGVGAVTITSTATLNLFDPAVNKVWVGGKESTVPNPATTDYLNVPLNGDACTWIASMPSQMPQDAEVYNIKQQFGDIHNPGNFSQ